MYNSKMRTKCKNDENVDAESFGRFSGVLWIYSLPQTRARLREKKRLFEMMGDCFSRCQRTVVVVVAAAVGAPQYKIPLHWGGGNSTNNINYNNDNTPDE